VIELPFKGMLLAKDKDYLYQKYVNECKSMRQIARELGCSKSTVAKHILEFGISLREGYLPRQRRGQIPFGMKMRNGQLVPHLGEQATISKLRELRAAGKSYKALVDWLKAEGVRSKNGGQWDRPTVYKILKNQRKQSLSEAET
jgi:transposase